MPGEVVLPAADKFGFCEGVVSADDLLRDVSATARMHGIEVVYGYHDIVHNASVRASHEANGVVFVNDVAEIPDGSVVVTSAHGVGPEIEYALQQKGCATFDAACPLVLHTHRGIQAARRNGEKVIYIGHGRPGEGSKLHDEIVGALGHMDYVLEGSELLASPIERTFVELFEESPDDLLSENGKYRIISQTTLDAEACLEYREKLKVHIESMQPAAQVSMSRPGDVCRAVRNRQDGVVQLLDPTLRQPDRVVVVTDPNSANGMGYVKQAREIIVRYGLKTEVIHVAKAEEVADLTKDGLTAITASASTPDAITKKVAMAFGADEATLVWERGKYKLEDANSELIEAKLASLRDQNENV